MTHIKGLDDLKKMAELPGDQEKRLAACSCDQIYNYYTSILKQARQMESDPESQFMLFMRSGELFKIVLQKDGFSGIDNMKKAALYESFNDVVSRLTQLEEMLTEKYKVKDVVVEPMSSTSSAEIHKLLESKSILNEVEEIIKCRVCFVVQKEIYFCKKCARFIACQVCMDQMKANGPVRCLNCRREPKDTEYILTNVFADIAQKIGDLENDGDEEEDEEITQRF